MMTNQGAGNHRRPRWTVSSYHHDHRGEWQHPRLMALLRDLGYRVREAEPRPGAWRIYAW
ncbi:MAG: hypothetical protein R6X25_10030 [Candidatus Krumholzibacteriia bacterium]